MQCVGPHCQDMTMGNEPTTAVSLDAPFWKSHQEEWIVGVLVIRMNLTLAATGVDVPVTNDTPNIPLISVTISSKLALLLQLTKMI